MTFESNSFEIQRWHSAKYVETWMADREREEGHRILRKKLVSFLPFETEASIRILDLGAGGGALSWEILSSFPKASIICQDFSEVMLGHAKQHLTKFNDQVTFVCSDLSTTDWVKPITGKFDAIVSSLVMHTVPGRVKGIFSEVFSLVKPGGCFIFADNFSPPGPMLEQIYLKDQLLVRQARIKAETGINKSLEEIKEDLKNKPNKSDKIKEKRIPNPLRKTLTLINNLEWLKESGFSEVDCLWKGENHAVIGGFKHLNSGYEAMTSGC